MTNPTREREPGGPASQGAAVFPRALVLGLTIIITIAWAANLTVGYLAPERSEPALNAIFALVAGAVMAFARKGTGDDPGGGDPP